METALGRFVSARRYAAGVGWVIGYIALWLAVEIGSALLGQLAGHDLKALAPAVQGILEIAGVLALTWAFRTKGNKADLPSLGMVRPRWTWLIVGLIAGALGILVVCGVEYALGWLHPLAIQLGPRSGVPRILFMLAVFIPSIGVGFTEELAFRGYAFQTLAERGPIWVAALVSTLLWAGLHFTLGGFGISFVLSVTAMGIVFVILRLLSGSLWLPIGFHAAWDFTQTYVTGVATTGSGPHDPALLPVSQTGPTLWVGSAPSIEGGMLYLILMLLILAGLVIFMRASGRRLSRRAA